MNRDLKFRAWSGDKMFFSFTMFNGSVWDSIQDRPIDWPVMQYIGHLDRGRYRIYEGDILANPKGEKGLVVFHEAGFYLKSIRKNGSVIYIQLTEGFLANKKVIGNIHEHPHLLEAVKS